MAATILVAQAQAPVNEPKPQEEPKPKEVATEVKEQTACKEPGDDCNKPDIPPPVEQPKPKIKPKPKVSGTATYNVNEVKSYAQKRNAEVFGEEHWGALLELWQRESGWQVGRANSEGACGIPQALPCSKIYGFSPERTTINGKLFIVNPDYKKEIEWGLSYIKGRYSAPTNALATHNAKHWY